MSILKLYSINDIKVGSFTLPFCAPNVEVAKRSVALALASDDMLKHFAADYNLVCLGSFDSSNGTVSGTSPAIICTLADILVSFPIDFLAD